MPSFDGPKRTGCANCFRAVRVFFILVLFVLSWELKSPPITEGKIEAKLLEGNTIETYQVEVVTESSSLQTDEFVRTADENQQPLLNTSSGNSVVAKTNTTTLSFPYDIEPHQIVITMCDDRWNDTNTSYLALSSAINQAYAEYHGYRFLACAADEFDKVPVDQPHVAKLFCNLKALAMPDVKMIVYLDSDAIMRNFSKTFADFIDEHLVVPEIAPNFDVIVPTDCSNFKYNTGLQIWRNSQSAIDFLKVWINLTLTDERMKRFPYEQKAFKILSMTNQYNPHHDSKSKIAYIPHNTETWHIAACSIGDGSYRRPPRFIAHVPGKWKAHRVSFMSDFILDLCSRVESEFFHSDVKACHKLLELIDI
jgi:hypothetical protein